MEVQYIQVDDILVLDRLRKDNGDLSRLAESIKEKDMINPVIVMANVDRTTKARYKWILLCGYRRLVAARDILGWKAVPAELRFCSDARSMLSWEAAENTMLQYSEEEVGGALQHFSIIKKAWEEMEVVPDIEVANPFKLAKNNTESVSETVTITVAQMPQNANQSEMQQPDAGVREQELLLEIQRLKGEKGAMLAENERLKKENAEYKRSIDSVLDENVSLRIKLGM